MYRVSHWPLRATFERLAHSCVGFWSRSCGVFAFLSLCGRDAVHGIVSLPLAMVQLHLVHLFEYAPHVSSVDFCNGMGDPTRNSLAGYQVNGVGGVHLSRQSEAITFAIVVSQRNV